MQKRRDLFVPAFFDDEGSQRTGLTDVWDGDPERLFIEKNALILVDGLWDGGDNESILIKYDDDWTF